MCGVVCLEVMAPTLVDWDGWLVVWRSVDIRGSCLYWSLAAKTQLAGAAPARVWNQPGSIPGSTGPTPGPTAFILLHCITLYSYIVLHTIHYSCAANGACGTLGT